MLPPLQGAGVSSGGLEDDTPSRGTVSLEGLEDDAPPQLGRHPQEAWKMLPLPRGRVYPPEAYLQSPPTLQALADWLSSLGT